MNRSSAVVMHSWSPTGEVAFAGFGVRAEHPTDDNLQKECRSLLAKSENERNSQLIRKRHGKIKISLCWQASDKVIVTYHLPEVR